MSVFEAEGLDTALIERRLDRLPGCYAIVLAENGERSFLYWRDTSAARTLFEPPALIAPADLEGADLVYLSGISVAVLSPKARTALIEYLYHFRMRGGLVAFDSNYRPRLWPDLATAQKEITAFWSVCDVALPSLDDEVALFGDSSAEAVIERLTATGITSGALKRGEAGPLPIGGDAGGAVFSPAEKVIDTTAAGDSFNAAYIAALLQGGNLAACMQAGHNLARRVVACRGAILPIDGTDSI